MGCKHTRNLFRPDFRQSLKTKPLSKIDIDYIKNSSNLTKDEIDKIFLKFENNYGHNLIKSQFKELYGLLRPEPAEKLDKISDFVFNAFDTDNNNLISLKEFVIGYVITTRGQLDKKLEYTFNLYDIDGNGYLSKDEIKAVIEGVIHLLDNNIIDSDILAKECFKMLDTNEDGKISKNEFINGLMANYKLRTLMSPFN